MSSSGSLLEDIINISVSLRERLPKSFSSGNAKQINDLTKIKELTDTINESIEGYSILRDLLIDFGNRIEYNISEHQQVKKDIMNKLNGIGIEAKESADSKVIRSLESVRSIDFVSCMNNQPVNVPVSETENLMAVPVDDKNLVRSDGLIYYIKPINKFAFRINGSVLMGNIGEVYTNEKNPQKIKTCSSGSNCRNIGRCTYYHPGTKDNRNFVSGGFNHSRGHNHNNNRKVLSRSTLSTDIPQMTKGEIELFKDQVFHDILCNLVIHNKIE